MNPRKALAFRQEFAGRFAVGVFGFAKAAPLRDDKSVLSDASNPVAGMFDCYPNPSLRSGPFGVRPFFSQSLWQSFAGRAGARKFQFKFVEIAVELRAITTNTRGLSTCLKPLQFLAFPLWRFRAACSQMALRPVQALVQSRAWRWARLPITTWPNRLWLAVPRVCLRATRAFAADLAAATDTPSLKASCGFSAAGLLHFHARATGPSRAFRGESYV